MGLTIEWNELTRWSLVLIPAVAVSIVWLAHRKRERKEFKEAQACLNSGQYVDCLKHLSKADENWSFNVANSTPKTVVQDIDRLAGMVELIGVATAKAGTACNTSGLLATLRDFRSIYSDKKSFKFGSFTLKSDPASRVDQLSRQIAEQRSQLRRCYMSVIQ